MEAPATGCRREHWRVSRAPAPEGLGGQWASYGAAGRRMSARNRTADEKSRLALPGQNPEIYQHFQCLGYLGRIAQTPEIAAELFVSAQVVLACLIHDGAEVRLAGVA